MAQLYKMTLYVCDLEEDLCLEEIKERINDIALDGIAVNCITHYANEQVGKRIDFSNNIDINYTDSKTEQWEKYFDKKYENNGWISVKDRLPDPKVTAKNPPTVLAVKQGLLGKIICVARYNGADGIEKGKEITVTHWIPLPEPPKGEKE